MRLSHTNTVGGIVIRIDDVAGQEQAVLETIRQCWQGAMACAGGCRNIGLMEERIENGSIFLNLGSRTGTRLNPSSIEECLRHKLQRSIGGSGAPDACNCPNTGVK